MDYERVKGLTLQDMALSIYCDNYAKFLRNGENEHLSLSLSDHLFLITFSWITPNKSHGYLFNPQLDS